MVGQSPVQLACEVIGGDVPLRPLPEGSLRSGPSVVTLTGPSLIVDTPVTDKGRFGTRGERYPVRVLTLAVSDIVAVEIESLTDQHARGYSVWTGFFGSGRQLPGTTGVLIQTKRGHLLLRFRGAPIQAKTALQPLLKLIPDAPA
jgi:hypothetical protein